MVLGVVAWTALFDGEWLDRLGDADPVGGRWAPFWRLAPLLAAERDDGLVDGVALAEPYSRHGYRLADAHASDGLIFDGRVENRI